MRDIIYYEDELNDEFSESDIKTRVIDENYPYERILNRRLLKFFVYRCLCRPLGRLYMKLFWGHKIHGKEKLNGEKRAFFLYGNHTNQAADPLVPLSVCKKKRAYVIVHPDNVSIPVIGPILPYAGALPLPKDMGGMRNFLKAVERVNKEGQCVTIYPEAHIWPYYTHIRPFKDDSFGYAVKYNSPVYCFTNVYKKRSFGSKPKMETYIDGPFFPDKTIPVREARKVLRDAVYGAMCERSKENNVEMIKYLKKEG